MGKKSFMGLVLLTLFLIGCQEGVTRDVITSPEPEIRTIIVEEEITEEVKAILERGRPEQAEKFLKKLNKQCLSEIDLLYEISNSTRSKLMATCEEDFKAPCFKKIFDELGNQLDIEGSRLLDLCSDIKGELLDKGQYTDVDLADLYEELSKELSTKAQEGRVRLTDFYGTISLLPGTSTITSDYECSYNKYNCTDFNTHAEAQAVFEACGVLNSDIHWLDRDDDGKACETLPR